MYIYAHKTISVPVKDSSVLKLFEVLLDKYHFMEDENDISEDSLEKGIDMVKMSIAQDLAGVSNEEIVKILGVVYFVARRRSKGNREYLDFIHNYVGMRAGPGMRVLPNSDLD